MTKALIKTWLPDVYFLFADNEPYLVVYPLTQYGDDINVSETVREDATFELKNIAAGVTGKVQPLRVEFFQSWRRCVWRVSDKALVEGGVDIFQRNNITKLQFIYNLVHRNTSTWFATFGTNQG